MLFLRVGKAFRGAFGKHELIRKPKVCTDVRWHGLHLMTVSAISLRTYSNKSLRERQIRSSSCPLSAQCWVTCNDTKDNASDAE